MTLYDSNKRKEFHQHIATLHPFIYEPQFVDPADVARRNVITTFVIDSILAHSGDKKLRSSLDFRVRFAGYTEADDMWLPYRELRDTPQCHEYLWANNMKNLIPDEHRICPYAKTRR